MKKSIVLGLFSTLLFNANAQVEITTKSLDLESVNKQKNWFVKGAGVDRTTGKTYLNFTKTICDVDKKVDGNMLVTTYHGLRYDVDKLYFDESLNYVETVSKKYASTKEAVEDGILIFGKKLTIPYDPFFPYELTNAHLFTTVVTYGYSAGADVVSSYVGIDVNGTTKLGLDYCIENLKRHKGSSTANRQSKGEKWYPIYSNPVPNGGNMLYSTVGVIGEDKQHYIFRKFDKDLNLVKEQTFTFDYQCIIVAKSIEKSPGQFDYVFVALPLEVKKSKIKVTAANNYEYFYIDGNTYDIKEHVTFQAPKSRWVIDKVIHENNATYIIGGCSNSNTEYTDYAKGPSDNDYQNLQVAKFENGKLVYINSASNSDLQNVLKTSDQFKSTSKITTKMLGTTLNLAGNKLVYQGRQYVSGTNFPGLQAFVINDKGSIETVLSMKGEDLGSSASFSKDGNKFYWFSYDMGKYNKFKDGIISASKSKFLVNSLAVVTFDLPNNQIASYQNLENEDWAISHTNPFLMEDENKILMLGYKITKKAKESEVVFVSIKK